MRKPKVIQLPFNNKIQQLLNLLKLVESQSGLKEVYTMRKCEKCGANMKSDLRLKVNGGGYGIVVRVDEKHKATTIDDVRVAVCPECGYTEMYL